MPGSADCFASAGAGERMDLGQLDAAIRIGGITMILLLAWLLFRQRGKIGVPALLFPPMALCLSGFLIGNTPDPSLRLSGAPGAIAHFASGCTVVFLWWFCLACFDRQFRPRGGVLVVGLCWIALAGADRTIAGPVPALSYTLVGLGFGIVAHLIWRLYAEREGDLIQKRYDARAMVALLLGGLLLIDLSVDLLFGFACFDLRFGPGWGVRGVGLCWIALAGAERPIAGPVPALSYTRVGLGFGMVAHLIWRLYAEREGDLIQKRYDARAMVALLLGGLLLIDLSVDLLFGFAWRPLPFAMVQNAAILGFSIWLAGQVLEIGRASCREGVCQYV